MIREIYPENNYQPGPGHYEKQYTYKYRYFYKVYNISIFRSLSAQKIVIIN